MLTWQPSTNRQVEETRRRRQVQRLERRLMVLRAGKPRLLYRDYIAALGKELAGGVTLREAVSLTQ